MGREGEGEREDGVERQRPGGGEGRRGGPLERAGVHPARRSGAWGALCSVRTMNAWSRSCGTECRATPAGRLRIDSGSESAPGIMFHSIMLRAAARRGGSLDGSVEVSQQEVDEHYY